MNHPVQGRSQEVATIRVVPAGSDHGSFHVEFQLSPSSTLKDVQYVLELAEESPAKFISADDHGGVGCNGSRVFGRAGDGTATLQIDDNAKREHSSVEIRGGWATGHEAVTLVEPVVLAVGQENEQYARIDDATIDYDDVYDDDQVEAEYEERVIEEEREELAEEIQRVEKDVIEALEEKRLEVLDGDVDGVLTGGINEVEEEAVQALEDKRQDMNKVRMECCSATFLSNINNISCTHTMIRHSIVSKMKSSWKKPTMPKHMRPK